MLRLAGLAIAKLLWKVSHIADAGWREGSDRVGSGHSRCCAPTDSQLLLPAGKGLALRGPSVTEVCGVWDAERAMLRCKLRCPCPQRLSPAPLPTEAPVRSPLIPCILRSNGASTACRSQSASLLGGGPWKPCSLVDTFTSHGQGKWQAARSASVAIESGHWKWTDGRGCSKVLGRQCDLGAPGCDATLEPSRLRLSAGNDPHIRPLLPA